MTETLRLLLGELIDYAGLFPPAALSMSEGVERYAKYLEGDESWMLGRFITPASRLEEFERAAAPCLPQNTKARAWRLSVLGGADLDADRRAIEEFNRRHATTAAGLAQIDALEVKATSVEEIEKQAQSVPPSSDLALYIEIPLADDPQPLISAIKGAGARVKARTGGLVPEAFPPVRQLSRFLAACAAQQAAFKATAGLHHPLRSVRPLTYEPESATGLMHGFLNVFLAAAWLRAGMNESEAAELLDERDPAALFFSDTTVEWRDRRLMKEEILASRHGFAIAFGSCSFAEPVEDLRALGLMREGGETAEYAEVTEVTEVTE